MGLFDKFKNKAISNEQEFEKKQKKLAYAVKLAIGKRFIDEFATQLKLTNSQPIVDILKCQYNEFPHRQLLRKIASGSNGRITHLHLYDIVGYSERDTEEDRTWAKWMPKRGEVYMVDLGHNFDCEQSGIRPAVVISNDAGNTHSPSVVIIPISSKKKFSQKIHTYIGREYGLKEDSYALSEQIRSVSKRRFFYNSIPWKVATLPESLILEIQNSLEFELGFQTLMFEEDKAFRMVEHIKTLEQNIRVKKSHNLTDLLTEKYNELKEYCAKYRKDYNFILKEYDRVFNYSYQAI